MKIDKKVTFIACMFLVSISLMQCDSRPQQRAALEQDINDMIGEIDHQISRIEANMENMSDEAEDKWEETVSELKDYRANLEEKLDKMDDSYESGWEEFAEDVDRSMNQVESDLERIGNDIEDAFEG